MLPLMDELLSRLAEWTHDGHDAWVVQLHLAGVAVSGTTSYPGTRRAGGASTRPAAWSGSAP
jgi:hypothetical protein